MSKSHDNTSMYVDTVINFANYHIHTTYILHTYIHTTYRMSDHIHREIVPPRETVAIARVAIVIVGRGG